MKLARIHGPDDVRLDDVKAPACGPDDVILDVGACGICGSDVGYARLGGVTGPADTPMPIGHELAGTVSEVGVNCGDVAKVGDRVALHPGAAGFGLGNGGPEGGFTASEREALRRTGGTTVSLGGPILRIETAAVAAVSILGAALSQSAKISG